MCESYNIGDLVYVLYEQTPIAMGVWMGSERMGKHQENFAKIFQLDKGAVIYFETDDIYTFRIASSVRANGIIERRK
jgi:hypothetical protein